MPPPKQIAEKPNRFSNRYFLYFLPTWQSVTPLYGTIYILPNYIMHTSDAANCDCMPTTTAHPNPAPPSKLMPETLPPMPVPPSTIRSRQHRMDSTINHFLCADGLNNKLFFVRHELRENNNNNKPFFVHQELRQNEDNNKPFLHIKN